MAYSLLYPCPNDMLLYPHDGELQPDPINTRYTIGAKDMEATLTVVTIDVSSPSRQHVKDLSRLIELSLPQVTAI